MANTAPIPPTFSTRRRWMIGFKVCTALAAVLALTVMANYLAARHYLRLQWSSHSKMALSPQTVRVLQSLTNQVKAIVFFDGREEADLQGLVTSLLKEYNYVNPKIILKTVDPVRNPAEAELALATYKLTALKNKNFVIFDSDGRKPRVIYQNELADYQLEPVQGGQPREFRKKLAGFRGEMLFTTALFNLEHPRQYRI
jgi:hypothetical protein